MRKVSNLIDRFESKPQDESPNIIRPPIAPKPQKVNVSESINTRELNSICKSEMDKFDEEIKHSTRKDLNKQTMSPFSNQNNIVNSSQSCNYYSEDPQFKQNGGSSYRPSVPGRPQSEQIKYPSSEFQIPINRKQSLPTDMKKPLPEQDSYVQMNDMIRPLPDLPTPNNKEDIDYMTTAESQLSRSNSALSVRKQEISNTTQSPNVVPPPLPSRNKKRTISPSNFDDSYEIPEIDMPQQQPIDNNMRLQINQNILSSGLTVPPIPDRRLKNSSSSPHDSVAIIERESTYDALEDEDKDCLNSKPWYRDSDRKTVDRLLLTSAVETSFIVRPGGQSPYVLCVYVNGQVKNIKLRMKHGSSNEQLWAVGEEKEGERTFPSVMDLLNFHLINGIKINGISDPVYLKEISFT